MAQFLYFFDNAVGLLPTDIVKAGLGHVLPRCRKTAVSCGPGGVAGVVAVHSGAEIGYYADKQTWRKRGPGVWVGVWNELAKPEPEELAIDDQQPGHLVKLRDEREWLAPLAREWDGEQQSFRAAVPAGLDLDDEGRWITGAVEARYARLWEIAGKRWAMVSDDKSSATVGDLCDWAVECLQVNYRIDRAEAAMLGLFDSQARAAIAVLDAAIDWPTIREWQKKTAELQPNDALNSRDGVAA